MMHDFPYTDMHELNLDWFLEKFKIMQKDFAKMSKMLESLTLGTVDSSLSDTSVNPVQNKVIKSALDGKASGTVSRSDSTRAIVNSQFEVIDRITTNSAGQVTEVRTSTVGIPTATTAVAGLMSATDKTNLDTLMSDYQSASTALG